MDMLPPTKVAPNTPIKVVEGGGENSAQNNYIDGLVESEDFQKYVVEGYLGGLRNVLVDVNNIEISASPEKLAIAIVATQESIKNLDIILSRFTKSQQIEG